MDRVRGAFVVATKPAYDDPNDVLTEDTGFFQKDPNQAPAQFTADFGNLVQEELRNLVVAIGHTPATDDDTQLATAIGPALKDVELHYPAHDGDGIDGFAKEYGEFTQQSTTTASDLFIWLKKIPAGARITSIGAYGKCNGTADLSTTTLRRVKGAATPEDLATLAPAWTGTYARFNQALGSPHAVETDYSYFLHCVTGDSWNGTDCRMQTFFVLVDLAGAPPAP